MSPKADGIEHISNAIVFRYTRGDVFGTIKVISISARHKVVHFDSFECAEMRY